MTTLARRQRAPYKSERHAALDTQYPPESGFATTQFATDSWELPSTTLPRDRRMAAGRTHAAPWDAHTTGPGAAIEKPPAKANRRARDIAFGFAMAVIGILATLAIFYSRATP